MTITTSGFYQKNIDLFSRQNKDVSDIQVQVTSGKKTLSLKQSSQEITNLNASEEHKLEVTQFKNNAERITSDLERIDLSFDQLQNASIRLQELSIESSNAFLSMNERKLFKLEIAGIKKEIISVANGSDAFGNGYFSGISGETQPFKVDNLGGISYSGATGSKSLQISRDSGLRQNFSGDEVFLSAGQPNAKFSVFDAIDSFSKSLNYESAPAQSSNLLRNGTPSDIVFPSSGQAANFKFDIVADGTTYKIDSDVYANDFSSVAAKINSFTGSTGVSAAVSSDNKIRLSGTGVDLKIENYVTDLSSDLDPSISVQMTVGSNITDEIILPHSLTNVRIQNQMHEVFEHFNLLRTDLGVAASTAKNVFESTQNTLVTLNEDISKIEDADMAELLTNLQQLLTNKEAAQATFSKLTQRNLFDYLG